MTRVRAADPSQLFRSGGRTIADHMRAIEVPAWVPDIKRDEYQLTAVLSDEYAAAQMARDFTHSRHRIAS